jgi:hypothetical protein
MNAFRRCCGTLLHTVNLETKSARYFEPLSQMQHPCLSTSPSSHVRIWIHAIRIMEWDEGKWLASNRSTYERRKSQRLACYGHVNRMEDNRNVEAIMKWNPIDWRSHGRPKTGWKDDVEADLRARKITNWRTSVEDKLAWKMIVEQAKTHPGLYIRLRRRRRRSD